MYTLPLTSASASLILAGLFNLWISVLVHFTVYLGGIRSWSPSALRAGQVAYQTALWNGFLLLFVAVVIEYTAFPAQTNLQLALLQVLGTLVSTFRSLYAFWRGYDDLFVLKSAFLMRFLGLGHILDLLALAGIFFGIARRLLV